MLPDLREIKARRISTSLTQSQLAGLSNVSQSLIAKIEAGNIEPSYAKAKRLFDCLTQINAKKGKTAKDIMTKPVASVEAKESLKKAIKALEKHGFSQVPVLSKEKPMGSISEKGILGQMNAEPGLDAEKAVVEDFLEEALPTVQPNTPEAAVRQLLNFSNAVLVMEKGRITGIITKSDLLKQMLK